MSRRCDHLVSLDRSLTLDQFKAVVKPELYDHTDVIVCSVEGSRRLADLLAGGKLNILFCFLRLIHSTGDYDGDKGWACWDTNFVEPFVNADLKYSLPPPGIQENNFKKRNVKVEELIKENPEAAPNIRIREIQEFSLAALQDTSLVGKYSNFHQNSTYINGYNHPTTIELAYMYVDSLHDRPYLTTEIQVLHDPRRSQNWT
jgi:RNA-dependent RNA polymerase